MFYKSLKDITELCEKKGNVHPMAVVCAADTNTLETVAYARKKGIVEPILLGNETEIKSLLKNIQGLDDCKCINSSDADDAAQKAVDLVNAGEADAIMKGHVETSTIMHAIVKKENHMCVSNIMSHLTLLEIPNYHKLVGITDGALIIQPDLEKKKQIILNSISYFERLGYEQLKVALLAAVEIVNPKMPETIDADVLTKMCKEKVFGNHIVEGPISYDLAMRPGAALLKNYTSQLAADVDLLVVPSLVVGNILLKSLSCSAGAKAGGTILGAKVPIVITSRSSSIETKYNAVAIALA